MSTSFVTLRLLRGGENKAARRDIITPLTRGHTRADGDALSARPH